jgi:hypothetical protein
MKSHKWLVCAGEAGIITVHATFATYAQAKAFCDARGLKVKPVPY